MARICFHLEVAVKDGMIQIVQECKEDRQVVLLTAEQVDRLVEWLKEAKQELSEGA